MGIRSRIFFTVFGILFVGITLSYIVAERDLSSTLENQIVEELEKQASLSKVTIGQINSYKNPNDLDIIAKKVGTSLNSRVTLIDFKGFVVGDSEIEFDNLQYVENHLNRPEIIEAGKNQSGWSIRYSETLQEELLYLAIKDSNLDNSGFIRIAVPYTYVQDAFFGLSLSVTLIAIVAIFVSLVASVVAGNVTWNNLKELESATLNLLSNQKKKFLKALPTQRTDEIGSVARNVSEISENLRKQISLIAAQRDEFGNVLDNLGEGVLVTDLDGNITYENESIARILNIEKLVKSNINEIKIKPLQNMFDRAEGETMVEHEFEIPIQKNQTRWILGSINKAEQTNEYILVVRDITELRVNASMRRDFISNLSHELRTPVSVILANAETLLDRTIDNKKTAKTFSKAIMHNAQRISGLVTDLIDLSRLDYGELHMDIRPIDIENIINTSLDSYFNSARKKGINIKFKKQSFPTVLADHTAVERILTNLLDNAIKYTKSNNETEIEIDVKTNDNFLQIQIKDRGMGVAEEEMELVFNRFYRAASARANEKTGSGLGLAIVKNLTLSMGGEVGVKQRKRMGSIFWFALPLA